MEREIMIKNEKPKIETFALRDDRMFLNTLVHRIAKEKEVRIVSIGGVERVGFITGLDEEWLQITTTEQQNLALINIVNIIVLEETGNSLRTMKFSDDEEIDAKIKQAIKTYCMTIYVKARVIFKEKQESNSEARHELEDAPVA